MEMLFGVHPGYSPEQGSVPAMPRCSATLQAGANGTLRQRQRQKCADGWMDRGARFDSYLMVE